MRDVLVELSVLLAVFVIVAAVVIAAALVVVGLPFKLLDWWDEWRNARSAPAEPKTRPRPRWPEP